MSGLEVVLAIAVPIIAYNTTKLILHLIELYHGNKKKQAELRADLNVIEQETRRIEETRRLQARNLGENPVAPEGLRVNSHKDEPSAVGFLNETEFAINGRLASNFTKIRNKIMKVNQNKISRADKNKVERMKKLAKEYLQELENESELKEDPKLEESLRKIIKLADKYDDHPVKKGGSRKTVYNKTPKRTTRKSKIDL